ncbi:MAG: DUF7168 domain-containing protein [Planctomycetota bacterium]|jgi:hypothetical protein
MNRDEAIVKAKKLLSLGESDNPNEAAAAMAQAQKILDEYEINQAMLDEESPEDSIDDEEIVDFAGKQAYLDEDSLYNLNRWRVRLADIVAQANQCQVYTTRSWDPDRKKAKKATSIVGRPSDVEKVRYLFQYFKSEVTRLANRDGKGCGNSWRNNYRHGVLDTLSEMLHENKQKLVEDMKQKVSGNSTALVRIDKAIEKIDKRAEEVKSWVDDNLKLRSARSVPNHYNSGARSKGQKAGKEIKISQAKGALKGGH